jgi:aspartyl-tRNA(Asn)/glutamyl-tRNA(Gln) amidotransferase subunit B
MQGLVDYLRSSLPHLPDHNVETLVANFGLTYKDALTLLSFDNGDRYDYYLDVMQSLQREKPQSVPDSPDNDFGRLAGNW